MLIALCALLSDDVRADEGMWLPEQLPDMGEELAGMGLELSAEQLADTSQAPLGAIVSFGEYCSASFISADGLIGRGGSGGKGLPTKAAELPLRLDVSVALGAGRHGIPSERLLQMPAEALRQVAPSLAAPSRGVN